MKVIAFMTQKGGTGKTTLAASIGVAAQEAGERVFLIDLDPQGSLASWGERREADTPGVDRIGPDKLSAALMGLEKAGYTLAIIDTQGVDSPATAAAMRTAERMARPLVGRELRSATCAGMRASTPSQQKRSHRRPGIRSVVVIGQLIIVSGR